jgi:hypothetical protein
MHLKTCPLVPIGLMDNRRWLCYGSGHCLPSCAPFIYLSLQHQELASLADAGLALHSSRRRRTASVATEFERMPTDCSRAPFLVCILRESIKPNTSRLSITIQAPTPTMTRGRRWPQNVSKLIKQWYPRLTQKQDCDQQHDAQMQYKYCPETN